MLIELVLFSGDYGPFRRLKQLLHELFMHASLKPARSVNGLLLHDRDLK